jgi:hypothetical protein
MHCPGEINHQRDPIVVQAQQHALAPVALSRSSPGAPSAAGTSDQSDHLLRSNGSEACVELAD